MLGIIAIEVVLLLMNIDFPTNNPHNTPLIMGNIHKNFKDLMFSSQDIKKRKNETTLHLLT